MLYLKVRGLILENTFTSIPDMVDALFGKLACLKSLILANYWPSSKRIKEI